MGIQNPFKSGPSGTTPANVQEAFSIVGDSVEAYGENRRMIGAQYTDEQSAARARMGASGFRFEGTAWEGIRGNLIRKRDEAYKSVDEEEEHFKGGTAYRMVREDFERMGTITAHVPTKAKGSGDYGSGEESTYYSLSGESAISGESYFTKEQRGKVLEHGSQSELFEYAVSLRPTFDEYLKFRFGSDEDKAAFSDSMTTRIEASNVKYARSLSMKRIEQASKNTFYKPDDPVFQPGGEHFDASYGKGGDFGNPYPTNVPVTPNTSSGYVRKPKQSDK